MEPVNAVNWETVIAEKVKSLAPEQQQQVVNFIDSLLLPQLSYRELAQLPIAERHRYLAPLIQATAAEFSTNPELSEFESIETPEWEL